jgi:hypothetical protein
VDLIEKRDTRRFLFGPLLTEIACVAISADRKSTKSTRMENQRKVRLRAFAQFGSHHGKLKLFKGTGILYIYRLKKKEGFITNILYLFWNKKFKLQYFLQF